MENLIESPIKKTEEDGDEKKNRRPIIKSATDLQRLKLEKLMKNPDKPIIIPEQPREKDYMQTVPSFVRNVMGSSAGAGSGEFHVYRHLRRKEYARQKCIQAKSIREQLDEEYQMKLEKNRFEADAKTAKKRAKRMKKKQRAKKPRAKLSEEIDEGKDENSSEEDDDQNENDESEVVAIVGPSVNENSDKAKLDDEGSKDEQTGSGEEKLQQAAPKVEDAEKDDGENSTENMSVKEPITDDKDAQIPSNSEELSQSTSVKQETDVEELPK